YRGPVTVEASRYAVTTQETCEVPPRSPTIVGSAVETIVWSSAASSRTSSSAPKITRMRGGWGVTPLSGGGTGGAAHRSPARAASRRADVGGRLEDRRERPQRERQVADGVIRPQVALLSRAADQPLEQRSHPFSVLGERAPVAVAEEDAAERQVPGL